MKLFYKFFFPVTLIIILSLTITSACFIKVQDSIIVNQSHERLNKNISTVEDSFNIFTENYLSMAKVVANDKEVKTFLENYDLKDTDRVESVRNYLITIMKSSNVINNVLLVPESGIMNIDAVGASKVNAHDLSKDEILLAYKSDQSIDAFIRSPKMAPVNNVPIISIAAKTKNEGKFLGYVTFPINLTAFMTNIIYPKLNDVDVQVLLVDKEGKVFASKNEELIYNESYNLKNLDNAFFNEMVKTKNGILEKDFLGLDALVGYQYYEPLNSYIIAFKDTNDRKQLQINSILKSSIFLVIVILISALILFIYTKKLVTPINHLVQYSGKLTNGDFSEQIDPTIMLRRDEIGMLSRSYKIMVSSLRQTFKQLEDYAHEVNEKNTLLKKSQNELTDKLCEIKSQKEHIDFIANHDSLTSLPNRRQFYEKLDLTLKESEEGALLLFDLDNFQSMNDTMGHGFGDKVLVLIAERMRKFKNEKTFVSRFGGDEFAILLTDSDILSSISDFIGRIISEFNQTFIIDDTTIEINFSIGISLFPHHSKEANQLVMDADLALYTVKNSGKNNYDIFNPDMKNQLLFKDRVEKALKNAILENGFKMLYQPQVSPNTGEIVAYEALIRLKSMEFSPGQFIPIAEESNQIIEMGRWVTREVIRQISEWQEAGLSVKPVSINFSANQLYDSHYLSLLKDLFEEYHVSPSMLEIEMTETSFIKNIGSTASFLQKIKEMGVKISIDDFGTGYSSLTYLTYMPISKLKLDNSLCKKFLNNTNAAIIKCIISLAHSLDLEVVAEGIEEYEPLKMLVSLKCDIIQGYYFSKPLEVNDVVDTFNKNYLNLL